MPSFSPWNRSSFLSARAISRTSMSVASLALGSTMLSGRAALAHTTGAVHSSGAAELIGGSLQMGLVGGMAVAFGLVGYGLLTANRNARRALAAGEEESLQLKRRLKAMQAALGAQPQIIIRLDSDDAPKLLFNSLQAHGEIPIEAGELLAFNNWIRDGAMELSRNVSALLEYGRAFTMTVRTDKGLLLEVEGRASGDPILAFRDLSGSLRKEVRLLDQQEKLKAHIQLMQSLFDSLPMPVWFRDRHHDISWVNRAYLRAVDIDDPYEVYEKQIELLERNQLMQIDQQLQTDGAFKERLHTIIGDRRQVFEVIAVPAGDEHVAMAIDVAAESSVQGELDRHIAAHTRTLDKVNAAVAIFDSDQRISFHNKAYRDLWQLDEDWLDSRPKDGEILERLRATRLLPEKINFSEWKANWLSIYNNGAMLEDKWYLPDGRAVHVMVDQSPEGGLIYVMENLTDHIDLEISFNALLNVQRETLDALSEGVGVFAPNGRLKLFNPAFSAIWGLSQEELADDIHIQQFIHLCRPLYDSENDWDAFRIAITTIDDQRQPFEGRIKRTDDTVLGFACVPLPDSATLLTFVDITDEERAESALLEKNEALQTADRLKNDFISNISYELRTPLTSIMGFADLLGSKRIGDLNPRQREYLTNITASSAKLEAIISNILDLVTIDAGSFELVIAPVKISEILKAATLGVREKLKQQDISIDVDFSGDLDSMKADGARVIQVLYNLLQNAIDFSEPGNEVRLRVDGQGSMVAFTVEDDGSGMPEDIRDTVFDRFESHSRGARRRGVGLGLSIVKSIVDLHGGDVELLSKEGVGTKITVRFPINGAPQLIDAAE